jgi:hypothetical protein
MVGAFAESYRRYLIRRRYDPAAGKLTILKRALIESWWQPGFHNFWRVWNPGVGHLLFHLYLWFGGSRRQPYSNLAVFLLCGLVHDGLVMALFGRPFIVFSLAFTSCGVLSLASQILEPRLQPQGWPKAVNATFNLAGLGFSISLAVELQRTLLH